jgi:hypothetical protein
MAGRLLALLRPENPPLRGNTMRASPDGNANDVATPDAAVTGDSSPAPVDLCLNCGTPAPGNFCPQCGQETAREPQDHADLLRRLFTRILSREGQLWQTLSKLLFAPGALTVEYMAGRRARYLRPFRLYLMASVIVFAIVHFFGLDLGLRFYGERGVHVLRSAGLPVHAGSEPGMGPGQIILAYVDTPAVRRFSAMSPDERFKFLRARRAPYASYFVLFLVPALALTLNLFYRSRRRRYGEHLVFGLHCQTFLLFAMLVDAKLPAGLANLLALWVVTYFAMALKRVYGGTWTETLGRGSLILALYFAIYFIASVLLVLALLSL